MWCRKGQLTPVHQLSFPPAPVWHRCGDDCPIDHLYLKCWRKRNLERNDEEACISFLGDSYLAMLGTGVAGRCLRARGGGGELERSGVLLGMECSRFHSDHTSAWGRIFNVFPSSYLHLLLHYGSIVILFREWGHLGGKGGG